MNTRSRSRTLYLRTPQPCNVPPCLYQYITTVKLSDISMSKQLTRLSEPGLLSFLRCLCGGQFPSLTTCLLVGSWSCTQPAFDASVNKRRDGGGNDRRIQTSRLSALTHQWMLSWHSRELETEAFVLSTDHDRCSLNCNCREKSWADCVQRSIQEISCGREAVAMTGDAESLASCPSIWRGKPPSDEHNWHQC